MRALRSLGIAGTIALTLTSAVRADAFELNQFRPTPLTSDGFAVAGAQSPGHLGFNAALTLDYAKEPLVVELATKDQYAVVTHQLAMHLTLALGLGSRGTLFAGVPVNLVMNGDDPPRGIVTRLPRPDGAGLGDAYLGARVRIAGDEHSRATFALQATLSAPLASVSSSQRYSGDDMVQFDPRALLDIHLGRTTLRANLGARIRQPEHVLGTVVSHALTYGLGLQYAFERAPVRLLADLYGSSVFEDFFGGPTSPLEALFGAKYQHASGFHAALAAGPGITHGIGTPELRALATLGFARDTRVEPQAKPAPAPEPAPEPTPEPLPDADGDGVLLPADACPDQPEDRDGNADDDGCPDLDDDRDGVPDASDRCPGEAEDLDGFEDEDGCADADNDKDGIRDASDECPLEAGEASQKGCPILRVDESHGTLSVLGRVRFAPGDDHALPGGVATLRRIKSELAKNPALTRLRIEGHADARGHNVANMNLSKRRARTIARWLRDNGVAVERLHIIACGEAAADEESDGAKDRRVDLGAGEAQAEDCVPVVIR